MLLLLGAQPYSGIVAVVDDDNDDGGDDVVVVAASVVVVAAVAGQTDGQADRQTATWCIMQLCNYAYCTHGHGHVDTDRDIHTPIYSGH